LLYNRKYKGDHVLVEENDRCLH